MGKTKEEELSKIEADLVKSNICPDLVSSASRLVFGKGDLNASVVFVGEAPGKQEDLTGEPFVGASGKFLDELLDSINLERRDIYITNIVKYRPPNNRDPLPKEKEAFMPYLWAQLRIINPRLVVTLGRHSGNCFLPGLQISKDHGRPINIDIAPNLTILPLYHPAAALYNGSMRKVLIEDFKIIKELLKT